MEKIELGKYVELAYSIYQIDSEGEHEVFKFTTDQPDRFVFGHDQSMIKGFSDNILGLQQGDLFDFTLQPEDAFGQPDPELIHDIDKSVFHINGHFDETKVYEGAMVPMLTADGQRLTGFVTRVTEDKVTVDFNHQLAGCPVRYQGGVVLVREATNDDFVHDAGGCGCGSGEGHGGCGCDHEGHHSHEGGCCGSGGCGC